MGQTLPIGYYVSHSVHWPGDLPVTSGRKGSLGLLLRRFLLPLAERGGRVSYNSLKLTGFPPPPPPEFYEIN